jgi:hypothetical protein
MKATIAIVLATAGLVSALTTIFNHLIAFGKLGDSIMGKYVNKTMKPFFDEIHTSLDNITEQINSIKDENDKREIQRLRYECLKFANEVRKGVQKSRREYEEIFRMEQSYEELIARHNIKNGFMMEEMKYIHAQYRELC